MNVSSFIDEYYERFNSRELRQSAEEYKKFIDDGGKMFLSMAGAMSTAGMGKIVSEMIREGKIHAISATGANLEEDIFRLVAKSHYVEVPKYKDLTPQMEKEFLERKLNRVTDICIPEEEAMLKIAALMEARWMKAVEDGERKFPHEFFWDIVDDLEVDPLASMEDSWVVTAKRHNIPIIVPGWADSTIGNAAAARLWEGELKFNPIKEGMEYMRLLINWYLAQESPVGFFQIGGGIAGDFPICVVPMLRLEMEKTDTPLWAYFCQISDSTTSYGSYSGAVPNEKITWDKLSVDCPKFMIESDATIVAPLIFKYVLGH